MLVEVDFSSREVFVFVRKWYSAFLNDQITTNQCFLEVDRMQSVFDKIDALLKNSPVNHLNFERPKRSKYKVTSMPELTLFFAQLMTVDEYIQKLFRLYETSELPLANMKAIKKLINDFLGLSYERMITETSKTTGVAHV